MADQTISELRRNRALEKESKEKNISESKEMEETE